MPMAHLIGKRLTVSRSYDAGYHGDTSGGIGMGVAASISETRFNDGPEVSAAVGARSCMNFQPPSSPPSQTIFNCACHTKVSRFLFFLLRVLSRARRAQYRASSSSGAR